MASTKEIKNRIKSVSDTQKITNAMYLISSNKMQRAKREAEESKPFFDLLRAEIHRMFAVNPNVKSRYYDADVDEDAPGGRNGILIITADKGLAGAYNQNIIKEAQTIIDRSEDYKLYVVGEHGWKHFNARGYNMSETFDHTMLHPTLAIAREINSELLHDFREGVIDRVYVCYTEYTGGMSSGRVMHDRLIPFDKDDFVPEEHEYGEDASETFEYEPDPETVMDRIMESYMVGYIYSALVNSYCAEQSARMMAMDAANNNASDILDNLKREYNHERQNAITQEITEISSGARSLKKAKAARAK